MLAKNMGVIDRALRLILGAFLILWALRGGPIWLWIGVVPLITGLINTCPLYSILGIKTCKDC